MTKTNPETLQSTARSMSATTRAVLFASMGFAFALPSPASPVPATFQIDSSLSHLELTAKLLGYSETVDRQLAGELSGLVDLGDAGILASVVEFSLDGGSLSPSTDFEFSLVLNAVKLSAGVGSLSSPGGTLQAVEGGGSNGEYSFAAQNIETRIDQGMIDVAGLVTASVELADQQISGSSLSGDPASLTLTATYQSGPYTVFSARLSVPIALSTIVDLGGDEIEFVGSGLVVVDATIVSALSPIAGDFDANLIVDEADLSRWRTGFGLNPSTRATGDANGDGRTDGADLLAWQRNFGLAPPAPVSIATVPELSTSFLAALAFPLALRAAGGSQE